MARISFVPYFVPYSVLFPTHISCHDGIDFGKREMRLALISLGETHFLYGGGRVLENRGRERKKVGFENPMSWECGEKVMGCSFFSIRFLGNFF